MSEGQPNTPKICPEPGCGLEMTLRARYVKSPTTGLHYPEQGWVCPRNADADAHALCARLAAAEAKVRESGDIICRLESDLTESGAKVCALTAANAAMEEKLAEAAKPCEWPEDEWDGETVESSCGWCAYWEGSNPDFCPGCGHPVVVKETK